MSVFAAGGNATSSALVAMDDELEDASARNRALAVARGGGGGSGSRGGSGGGASMTRASALWSMTQVYAVLLLAVWGYNCAATTLRATRTDLSPEGMMLAGGVDPSVIARYNASTYGRGYGSIDRSYDEMARWKHATRYTIRGSFNAAAGVSKGVARAATSSAKWGFQMAISAMERAGMGPVIDVCSMMSVATTSSIGNMMWLVTFAISPIAEYALMPIYDFVLDGLEPLYLYFVTGTMDFFEDMTFTLEQNLATVLDEKVLSIIRWPLHIFLNPFKWPQGFYEAVLYPTYRFCAYPELFDMKEQPVPPIVKRTYGESCRSNAWGEWTKCSVQCGVGFRARVNHCGRRQFNRCVGPGVIGCDGVCESGLRVDCNGSCGGKALLDKCGICGGNNAALGCDGKCFSGMREDTVGNCCHSASITANGVCGSGENLPTHLRAAAEAARAKAEASKNKPPLMRRIYQKMRPVLLIVFNISMTALRLLSLVVHVMVRTSSFVIGTLFSTLTLKIIGSLTAGYMIVGVVDKKLQKNIGSFVREAVPFMDEKPREQEKDKSPAHAYLYDEKPKTKKEIIEDWVLAGVARLKRGSEVPGSVANYVMWLIGKLNAFVVYASPFVLRVMRDASYVEVSRARQQAKLAEHEKRTMHRQCAILAQRVEEEVRTEEERQLIMQEAEDAREKAVNTERRAAELAARNEAELVRTATEEAATKARLEAEEASAKAQVAAEEERVRREEAEAKARLEAEDSERRAQVAAEEERVRREEAEAKARLEAEDSERRAQVAAEEERVRREEAETKAALEALITAEEERVRREEAEAKARLEAEEAERKAIIAAEEERVRKEEAEAKARLEAEEAEIKARLEAEEAERKAIIAAEEERVRKEEAEAKARIEAEEVELKARREEEEAALRRRLEAEEAELKAHREEEERAIAALREEEEQAIAVLHEEEERTKSKFLDDQARLEAELKARREEEEAALRARIEAEEAELKARREEEEAALRARIEAEEAELKARREEEERAIAALREEEERTKSKFLDEQARLEAELKARREEEERAIAALHEKEERTKSRLLDEQERLDAEDDAVRARLEQEKAERQRRLEAEEAEIKARIEAEEAKTRERLEAEQAERKARLEQEEAEIKARIEAEEAKTRERLEAEQAERKARLEQEEAETKARIEAEEAKMRERLEAEQAERKARLEQEEAEIIRQRELEEAERKARLEQEEAEYKQRLEMEQAELQGRLEEETRAKSRPEAVTLSHVDQLMQRTEAAKKVMLETKSRLDPQSEVIKQFEGANVGKKNALKKKSALESVQVHSSVLSKYFVAKSRHTLLEEELVSAVKYRDLSDEKNVDDAIRARLREAEPLPEAIRDKFSFLLKYRARRNAIVALSKLSVNHPDDGMRRRCFRSLNKITRASKFGLLVVARCEALPNALSMLNDWSVTTTTDENAPWEALELIHNLVSSRQMRASVSLMRQLEGDTFARCLLSILKTVPHLPAVQGMGLATLWQIVRSSGYDTALQNSLIEDGVIRHLMENREYAKQNSALARVVIGCALSIAMDNANAQKQMTDKRNALPKRIVRILGIHGDIDYKGEFKPLNEWLMDNA